MLRFFVGTPDDELLKNIMVFCGSEKISLKDWLDKFPSETKDSLKVNQYYYECSSASTDRGGLFFLITNHNDTVQARLFPFCHDNHLIDALIKGNYFHLNDEVNPARTEYYRERRFTDHPIVSCATGQPM